MHTWEASIGVCHGHAKCPTQAARSEGTAREACRAVRVFHKHGDVRMYVADQTTRLHKCAAKMLTLVPLTMIIGPCAIALSSALAVNIKVWSGIIRPEMSSREILFVVEETDTAPAIYLWPARFMVCESSIFPEGDRFVITVNMCLITDPVSPVANWSFPHFTEWLLHQLD